MADIEGILKEMHSDIKATRTQVGTISTDVAVVQTQMKNVAEWKTEHKAEHVVLEKDVKKMNKIVWGVSGVGIFFGFIYGIKIFVMPFISN